MKKALPFITFALLMLGASDAFAQAKAVSPKEAVIRELVGLTTNKEDMEKMSAMMMSLQKEESERLAAAMIDDDPQLKPEEKAELKKSISDFSERMYARVDEFFTKELDLVKTFTELSIPLYDKHFTESELREMVAFFKTPTGQKNIKIGPVLMMDITRGFMESIGPKLTDFVNRVSKEEVTRLKQKFDNERKAKSLPQT